MENEKAEFVKEEEFLLKDIQLESFEDSPKEIKRISFISDEKTITWKPKIKEITLLYGMDLIKNLPLNIDNIPKKLKELGSQLNRDGSVNLLVSYLKKDFEGKTYFFITSEKTFNEWSIEVHKSNSTKEKEVV